MAGGGVLDENNCYICRLELRYGVMVALQILVLSAQVRILVPQLCSAKLSLLRKRAFLTPVCCRRQPLSGASRLRQASAGRLRCFDVCDISLPLRRAACAAPVGVAFQFCRGKIPAPGGPLMRTSYTGHIPEPLRPQVAFRLCVAKSRDRAGALMSTF